MARKDGSTLRAPQKVARGSWAAVGIDTSMTACSAVCIGYDGRLDKYLGPTWGEIRWMPDDDYYLRLGQAAKGHELLLDVLKLSYVEPDKVHIACEEPFFFGVGAKVRQTGQWIKQQAEVSGAFKGSLVRYGFKNIHEINNSQWHATLRNTDGVEFINTRALRVPSEKDRARLQNKFVVKTWAIQAFGLPEFPDLVSSKTGAKIPRPESGYGANAKAVQPNDIYDAAAVCAWMADEIENGRV